MTSSELRHTFDGLVSPYLHIGAGEFTLCLFGDTIWTLNRVAPQT